MRTISVGFTIYEAQKLEVDDKTLLDPLVVVRCCNKEYVTKKKKKKYNAVNWEESHIWDRIILSEIEWNVAKIEFEIQSANIFLRNDIIGVISFELKLIKNKKNHEIYGTYPILYKNGTEIRGQLRLKVIVCDEKEYITNNEIFNDLTQGDNKYNNISENDEDFYTDLTKAVVEENNITLRDNTSTRFYYLYVNIHKIEDIYVDINKKKYRDLYITCDFNGCHLKSSQGRNCTNYTFNECFKIPIATPILEDSIVIKIWDWNFLTNDELLAIGVLSFNQIKNKSISPTWLNLYGFHKDEINLENISSYELCNDFSLSLEGNYYLGRICISSYVERINNFDNLNIAMTQCCLVDEDPLYIPITLLCDVYLVTGILAQNIYVQLSCGPYYKNTDYVTSSKIEHLSSGRKVKPVKSIKYNRNVNLKSYPKEGRDFFHSLNFDNLLNLDNFFNEVTEKQKIIENNENTEFYFSSRKGKIENMKLCVVRDELQQWDVLINVYEKTENSYSENIFNSFLYPSASGIANNLGLLENVDTDNNGNNSSNRNDNHSANRSGKRSSNRSANRGGNNYNFGEAEQKLTDQQGYRRRKNEIHNYEEQKGSTNDRRIAYYRLPLKNVLLHNEKLSRCPIWIPLKNIPRNVDSDFNCMYNIFQNGSILINLEKSYDVQLGLNRRKNLIPVSYELRCYIYACRNVISHFNNSPNTFVHVSCSGKMKITSLVLNNSNPVFLQCLKLNVVILTDYSIGLPTIPLIVVTLYEFYNNTFYFIGRCFCNYDIYLRDGQKKYNIDGRGSNYNVVQQITPKWVKLKGSKHIKAMYSSNLWQQYGNDKRMMQEYLYEKQREIHNNSDGNICDGKDGGSYAKGSKGKGYQHNDLLRGERVGDILLYFELVQAKDAIKIPIYPMITEIKKCTLSFFCMSLENLVLIKKQKYLESLVNESTKYNITHPIVLLSVTSYSSYGKKKNELLIKYEKSLKTNTRIQLKNWKNSFNQQSFEMFSIDNLTIDIPLDPIFDPILNVKVYNKKIKQKYFIGETNISLIPYLPWIKNFDEVLYYLQAHDDYSETLNIKSIDSAFNIYKNKNAALVITAISLADCEHAINLKEELKKYENDDDELWNKIPLFKNIEAGERNQIYDKHKAGGDNSDPSYYPRGVGSSACRPYPENGAMQNIGMYNNAMYNYGMQNYGMQNYGMQNYGLQNYDMPNSGMQSSDMQNNNMQNNNMQNNNMQNNNMQNFGIDNYDMQNCGMQNNCIMINNMHKNKMHDPSDYGMVNYSCNYATNNMESFFPNMGGKAANHFYNIGPYNKINNQFYSYYEKRKKDIYNIKYQDTIYKLYDDGVPEAIKSTYNVKNYPYIKILTSKFILNVYIPPRFILYCEGDKLNIEKYVKNAHRVSVDGILENYLDDILIPSIPLKKKCNIFLANSIKENKIEKEGISFGCFDKFPFVEMLGGQIKCFAKIKYRNLVSENIPLSLKHINSQNTFRNTFRGSKKIPLYLKIRVYVLRGLGIYGVNQQYTANPYLIFSLGEKTSNLRNSYKECNMNPDFRCLWESEAIFPEDEILTISVYSAEDGYDKQINDIYIGSTEINLFDRWMSKEWRHMMKRNKVPVEYRPLYNNHLKGQNSVSANNATSTVTAAVTATSAASTANYTNNGIYSGLYSWNNIFSFFDFFAYLMKPAAGTTAGHSFSMYYSKKEHNFWTNHQRNNNGILEMWVEIMDYEQSKKIPIHKMMAPKKMDIEIRIIIWKCIMIANEENINKTFDLTISAELDCITYKGKNALVQTTDVHYNCKTGNAIFNWRIVYPNISHPLNTCFLQLAAYNNNNVGVSEFLGEVNLELSKYIHKASQISNTFELDAELKLRKKNGNEVDTNYNGYIQVTVQFVPQTKANIKPVGLGREEPNRNPYLRTPDSGRDWNDFVYSIGFNDIYKPFWSWLKMFFICLLIILVFVMSFVYPSLLM
ncbi:ferlin, putative [Plasmodium malariae]|uniref:Ferlin, putative n=1 Tax=Plasmodium malariae TaxID=5858 RepID=A0A1A8W9I1_PLAMA|nr:ferlin, putative [Plasmodium malariae]